MADSIPICDVLSEAMGYLTKLGTNIRLRSEKLRDKRIRKDKLKNTHAIHKAVDKVLLICELSKKSIENVETGVKNLLLQMEKAGATFGQGPKTRVTSESGVDYEYFMHESRRLKIRDRISVGHYTSVHVVSTSMTLSMIEKYPVYYDCKLYRLRNRRKREVSVITPDGGTSAIQDIDDVKNGCVDCATDEKDETVGETDHNVIDSMLNLKLTDNKVVDNNVITMGFQVDSENKDSDDNQSHDQVSLNEMQQCKSSIEVPCPDPTKDESTCEPKPKKKKYNEKSSRFRHIKVIDSSSSSDNESNAEKISQCIKISENDCNTQESTCAEKEENQDDTKSLLGGDISKPLIKCVSLSKLLKPDRIKHLGLENKEDSKKLNEDSELKPDRIKDVGLENKKNSKKLNADSEPKPDRIKDLGLENKKNSKKLNEDSEPKRKHRYSKSAQKKADEIKYKKLEKLPMSSKSEDEDPYWSRKTKEIKNFKPKEFNVNISHLPKITHSFLEKHCLKKITQMGSVICEILNDTNEANPVEKEKNERLKRRNSTLIFDNNSVDHMDINKVKSALLYDSDSDNVDHFQNNNKKLMKTTFHEPDNEDDSDSERLKSNNKSQEIDVNGEKQNGKSCTSYFETTNNNSKNSVEKACTESNESECTRHMKKETLELKKLIVETNKDAPNKPHQESGETVLSSEMGKNNDTPKGSLHIENDPKFLSIKENKNKTETNRKSKESSESDNETEKLNVVRVKKIKKNRSDKSHKLRRLNKKKSELKYINDNNKPNEPQTLPLMNSESKEQDTNTLKNVLQESDSEPQIEKEQENLCISKMSVMKNSDSEFCNDEKPEESCDYLKKDFLDKPETETGNDNVPEVSCTVKQALLADSDCETENFNRSIQNEDNEYPKNPRKIDNQENIENSSNRDSCNEDTNKEDNSSTHQQKKMHQSGSEDIEMIKSSVVTDSSDDISKTLSKRRNDNIDSTPELKRKHIMQSMDAKKMLLSYSSSSDTEDEQLRNTLKEIKDYLLKGISSDEDDNKDKKDSKNKDENVAESKSKNNSSESESEENVEKLKSFIEGLSDSNSKNSDSKKSAGESDADISSECKVDCSSATPADSCSQNSDIQDTHDKEIDGLTNLKSLKKRNRRKPEYDRSTRIRRRRRMAKASGLISNEGFLEAESSSDAASLSGSDHADNVDLEDMPRVKLTDINGDGIGHLAKDDLLGESDTSVSHDEKKSYKKEEDTDEDNVKSKRRKMVAISSDSEAGSSRRKENNLRLSDFEDSEDESSEPVKNKRKKKVVESDASGGSSDDGKKKRRRIKTLDESDASGSDTENEGRNKHGRKNIRKVMSKNQLEEATKKAAREEKERIARITERQKLYNNLEFDESGKPDEVVLEKVVLDFDPETKEPLIQVDRGLVKKLKPHQANGIKFMWDACFESVKRIKKDKGSGCILAHCMGLGKTLQVVSLTHTLLTHGSLTGVSRVLVVCPLSTVLNWVNEFRMWLKHAEAEFEVDVYELSKFKQNSERAFQLSQWFEHGGVCVLGYEMFRNLSADKGKKFKKKILKNFQESLVDPGPDLVVCDEGHLLKNEKTSLSQSMNRVKTRRRIVLTGTPLQNNLKEYYCMVQFVKPNLLGKYNEYLNRFVNPITNGQYTDSTEHDIRVMKRRSHVLHKMLDGAVQRRDYGVLAPFLPPKHEYVLFITLTDVQIKLYHHYLDNYSRQPQPGKSSGFLFPDFQSLQRIWTHPLVLKYNSERYEIMQQKKREREEEDSEGSLVDFINDDSTPDESSTEESSEDMSDMSDDSRKKSKKKKSAKKSKGKDSKVSSRRGTRANPIELDDDEEPIESLEVKNENPTEWWMKLVSEEELEDMRNSHKLILLFDILRQCEAIGDKLLVFSQSLYSLDLIEHFLGKVDEATQAGRVDEKLGGHVGSWSPGVDYFRLDGSTSCENRSIWCKNFNRIDNQRARLFLISTRAGGLGINLVAANRVVIFDVSWNPSHDVQSIFRVYRFGQKKPCYVYRFLAMGTMEEKIYERQVTKQAISKRVIDEQQIDRHYAENDLAELYKFEPQPPVPRPLPPLPKDRLFAEMLKEHEAQIYKYHEHDSLLENKEEETLSEEERRAAWEDFENEKIRPPPQPFLSPYAMQNGMVQGLLAQQQQMAMATISAMLRKDMPNMSDQQLRETVPLILASNPGFMQKMSDIYKYAQPGVMNPGMMNPMNAGSGMSGGSGMGASALHYEPPWLRQQQQQQQQLRLQQLMQHQNSMGAKYYAGGLGSRDPMAMALQQQRARELMHRPRARGRPPLASTAPRPPPAHAEPNNTSDVVNLDSD